MEQKNVLFCILRDARQGVSDVFNQVNIPLYCYQKELCKSMYKNPQKAFIYQYDDKVIINDFGQTDIKNIFYIYSRAEKSDYFMCLRTAFSMMEKLSKDNDCSEKRSKCDNCLVILMEQNIGDADFKRFKAFYGLKNINFKVILVYNGNEEAVNIDDSMKRFVKELKDKNENSCGKVWTFKELKERGIYSL